MAAKRKDIIHLKAESIFNKKYKIKSHNDKYSLPEENAIFSTPPYAIEPLLTIKNSLNATKNLLNSKDIEKWRTHTGKTNPCGLVVKHLRKAAKPELCTQAWVKFHEILSSCNVIPPKCIENKKLTSLHLCEAPGAFIASLNHYIKSNFEGIHWTWLAATLNPFYEGNDTKRMISGERFIIETLYHWNFGESGDGDLMQWDNLKHLAKAVGGAGKADIVTADGSISCADEPDKQEIVIGQLLYCEVIAALVNLACGGSFVVKMFTMYEQHTVCILYLLCCLFDEVEIIKPGTSKPGNSEVYCVCRAFAGPEYLSKDLIEKLQIHYTSLAPEQAMFSCENLPENFIESVLTCAKTFSEFQTDAINKNIELFENSSKGKWKFLNQLRNHLAEEFVYRFNINRLQQESLVVSRVYLDGTQMSYWPESAEDIFSNSGTHETGSYVDRVAMSKLGWHERVVLQQDEISSLINEDALVNHIKHSVQSVEWLKGAKRSTTNVQRWNIDVGKAFEEIQSSRFCPANVISQLNEARRNANILQTTKGKALLKSLESRTQQKLLEFGPSSRPSQLMSALQQCGLLSTESWAGLMLDITGNARFVSKMIDTGVCSPERCLALLCQRCAGKYRGLEFPTVPVDNCLTHNSSEIEKFKSLSREVFDREKVADVGCLSNHNATVDVNSHPKPHILLASSFQHCQILELSYDELSSKTALLKQCVTALHLLRHGDCLVLEISDTLTQFTVAIIYILHLLFQEISLITPSFSPLPKQFLVCRDFVNSTQCLTLRAHMEKVLETMTTKPAGKDVIGFLPIKELFSEKFFKYIRSQTTQHIKAQLHWIVQCERLFLSKNASCRE